MTDDVLIWNSPGATLAQLHAIERRIGAALPADYRSFLEKTNGAVTRDSQGVLPIFDIAWNGQPWAKDFDTGTLSVLESADPSERLALAISHDGGYRTIREYIPADLVPIGHDSGGNSLVLGISGERRCKVFFWAADYATPNNQNAPNYDNVGFIANSFDEFVALLRY